MIKRKNYEKVLGVSNRENEEQRFWKKEGGINIALDGN